MTVSELWSALAGVGQLLEALLLGLELVVVFGTTCFALWQLIEMRRARQMEAAQRLIEILGSADIRKARRFVFIELSELSGGPESLTEKHWGQIERVGNSLNRVGLFLENQLFTERAVMELYHEVIIKCWDILAPYVRYRREKQSSPLHHKYFERLAQRARSYHCRHYPGIPILQPFAYGHDE